jgi:hypothetical protein
VNVSRLGCHGLVVTADGHAPKVIELPDLTMETAIQQANRLLAAVSRPRNTASAPTKEDAWQCAKARDRDRQTVLEVLYWLWDTIASPVLATLGHTAPHQPEDAWPHVWWCPTGPLTMLPIHAAGRHNRTGSPDSGPTDTVADRVVSSYTPTLTALQRTRDRAETDPARLLTVGMPITPGQAPLPAVIDEVAVLAHHFPPGPSHDQLIERQATRVNVLAAIADHSWIHLACHAGQHPSNPTRTAFALWDGPLTISDLAAQRAVRAELAFLSACQTATGSVRLLDEAMHLAAAMQLLGYRHVIATMWTIADPPAPMIADTVYTALTNSGNPDATCAAEAIHHAVQLLRRHDPANPLLWAPYVHFGP